jgi:hypothetical protein
VGKADEERQVFEEFATVAGLAIDPGSIRSEAPPLPDISCRIGGDTRYFELTRAANQGIADEVGHLLVKGRKTGKGGVGRPQVYNDAKTLRAAVERKAAAKHKTHGARLDLIVYYDGAFHPVPSFDWVESTFRSLQAEYRHRWGTLWLYDRTTKQILR